MYTIDADVRSLLAELAFDFKVYPPALGTNAVSYRDVWLSWRQGIHVGGCRSRKHQRAVYDWWRYRP